MDPNKILTFLMGTLKETEHYIPNEMFVIYKFLIN